MNTPGPDDQRITRKKESDLIEQQLELELEREDYEEFKNDANTSEPL